MNQAVGRVIRHAHDYGAIYFCDERFENHDMKDNMSSWVKLHLKVWNQCKDGMKMSSEFFRQKREEKISHPMPQKRTIDDSEAFRR